MRVHVSAMAFLTVLLVPQISAQSLDLPYARGIYFAGSGHYSSIEGDFDGQTVYSRSSEILVIPKLSPGFGAGGLLGYRGVNWAYEAGGYYRVNSSSFLGVPFDTSTIGFTFDMEWLPFIGTSFQPCLIAGVGISTLTVKDGSSDGARIGDALYYMGGFRAGLGIQICMTQRIFIRAQGLYRIDRAVSVQGVSDGDRVDLADVLNADGYEFSLIVGYIVF